MGKTSGFGDTPAGAEDAALARRDSGDLTAGTQVGEYLIEGTLGRGGMGTVYAARHPVIGKRVAIKVLAGHMSGDPALVRRFIDEARAVNKIGHPNIIDIFAFGQLPDKRHYFVMEFLEGETLAARLASGGMTVDDARHLLGQTASALEAAHREKIVHRDLKPENIWIARPKHGEPFIKILDFGIAKLLELTEGRNVTETGMMFGTPHYMSPEQCMGQNVDARTDLYALGVILYRVFGGRLPFDGKTFAEVVAQHLAVAPAVPVAPRPLPAGLEELILSCLQKDPAHRPQSAAEVGRRLEAALARAPADERTPEPLPLDTRAAGASGTRPGYGTAHAAAESALKPGAVQRWGRPLLVMAVAAAIAGAVIAVLMRGRDRPAAQAPAPAATPPPSAAPAAPPAAPQPEPTPAAPVAAPPAPTVVTPSPAPSSPPPAEPRREGPGRKPSRAEQRGLIQENPFK